LKGEVSKSKSGKKSVLQLLKKLGRKIEQSEGKQNPFKPGRRVRGNWLWETGCYSKREPPRRDRGSKKSRILEKKLRKLREKTRRGCPTSQTEKEESAGPPLYVTGPTGDHLGDLRNGTGPSQKTLKRGGGETGSGTKKRPRRTGKKGRGEGKKTNTDFSNGEESL